MLVQSLTPASVSGFLSPLLSSSSSSSSSSSLGFRVLHRETMAAGFSRALLRALAFVAIAFAIAPPALVHAGSLAPAPAPTSDGTSIDQGIAYVLMLVALVLTYLIHPLDASSNNF